MITIYRILTIALCAMLASPLAAELRLIKSSANSYAIDPARVVAIEPYIVYVGGPFIGSTESRSEALRHPRVYTVSIRGCRIIVDKHGSTTQTAVGGAALIGGGDAKNEGRASDLILIGVTVEDAMSQLYPSK
jgi:hypothetical protein